MHSIRHWISFFVGAFIFVLGLFPLIGKDAWIFNLTKSAPGIVFAYIVAFGGLYIIVDSFFEFTFHSGVGVGTLLIGFIVLGLGLVAVLSSMKVITFSLSFMAAFGIVYEILFMLEGLFLMIACFIMD